MPSSLELADNAQCFINQYVVDTTDQTSGFEAYSLTYAGADLKGQDTPDGAIAGRWWTHYFNSNADMRAYASRRGVPASPGGEDARDRRRRPHRDDLGRARPSSARRLASARSPSPGAGSCVTSPTSVGG